MAVTVTKGKVVIGKQEYAVGDKIRDLSKKEEGRLVDRLKVASYVDEWVPLKETPETEPDVDVEVEPEAGPESEPEPEPESELNEAPEAEEEYIDVPDVTELTNRQVEELVITVDDIAVLEGMKELEESAEHPRKGALLAINDRIKEIS